jgi:hypothetical protein
VSRERFRLARIKRKLKQRERIIALCQTWSETQFQPIAQTISAIFSASSACDDLGVAFATSGSLRQNLIHIGRLSPASITKIADAATVNSNQRRRRVVNKRRTNIAKRDNN